MIALLERFWKGIGTVVSGDWRHPDRRPLWAFASERTKGVEIRALGEARRSGHERIGTEHLLVAILAEEVGEAAMSLRRRNVSLPEVRSLVELLNGTKPVEPKRSKWLNTPQHTAAMFAADGRSRQLGYTDIEPEHVLYGILLDEDAVATRILRYLGVSVSQLIPEL
ncbi:Clp protease N-terminal domain-containing protein [Rubrobacter aplysinae]|uniref:Clp protease N-terminal domain-containing protein n=1 Tax=Rubrobacter aplysinae TaxID=909625 RepID=UPI00064BE3E3|nr:Clp protease N-terminal domain-containing protein [Rubrobacter aplysinae]